MGVGVGTGVGVLVGGGAGVSVGASMGVFVGTGNGLVLGLGVGELQPKRAKAVVANATNTTSLILGIIFLQSHRKTRARP